MGRNNSAPRILVAGSLVMDLIVSTERFPNAGETVLGFDFRTAPGGKGANQAAQAALLGAKVDMAGCVGADENGEQLISSLQKAGVHQPHQTRIRQLHFRRQCSDRNRRRRPEPEQDSSGPRS